MRTNKLISLLSTDGCPSVTMQTLEQSWQGSTDKEKVGFIRLPALWHRAVVNWEMQIKTENQNTSDLKHKTF